MKTFQQFREAYGAASALNWNILPSARKDPETEVTYHKDIGLPHSYMLPKGLVLRYAGHALDRSREKGIILPQRMPDKFEVIEVTMLKRRVTKWVVRFPASPVDDAVLAVLPDGTVKTAWINAKTDTHGTLDRSKYAAPPSF